MAPLKFKNTQETNRAVNIVSNIMNNVMGSSVEAEVGAIFHNGQ